jgi:hypothetical protein
MENDTKPAHVVGIPLDAMILKGVFLTVIRSGNYARVHSNRLRPREFMNGSWAGALE